VCYKDIVFVVDDSTSVIDPEFCGARHHFAAMKRFMMKAVEKLAGDIDAGHVRVGLVRYATKAEVLIGLDSSSRDSRGMLQRLNYSFPRDFRQVTLSNMHLGLAQARQVLADGDSTYSGAARRHLHIAVLSDFMPRSNSHALCDFNHVSYEACVNATGTRLLNEELAHLGPSFAVGSSRTGVTRWAFHPGCDLSVAPQMEESMPAMHASQAKVASRKQDVSSFDAEACGARYTGNTRVGTAVAMADAISCDKDCVPHMCDCPVYADVVFLLDTSRSAMNAHRTRCESSSDNGTPPLLIQTFVENVIDDFDSHSLFNLPDPSMPWTHRGGEVRVSAVTYNQNAEVAFGFLSSKADIVSNLTYKIDFSGQYPTTYVESLSTC